MTTTTIAHLVILALVTVYLPLSVVSMDTENGYLCNLCHSLQNEFPYPPPDAEPKVVRFTQLQNEQFGLPWDRGVTCLDVWNIVLDYANPNVQDEASCRSMAAAYAPQCCHHITDDDEPESHRLAQQQQENNNEEGDIEGVAARVEELSLTLPAQQYEATYNASGEKTLKQRPTERLINSTMGSAIRETNVESNLVTVPGVGVGIETTPSKDRESHSGMGTERNNDNDGNNDTIQAGSLSFTLTETQRFRERESHSSGGSERNENNVRRTAASISFLRGGKPESAP